MQVKIRTAASRWLLGAVAVAAAVGLAAGCGCGPRPPDQPAGKKEHADAVVKVWCGDERLGGVFGPRAKAWAHRHSATVQVVSAEADADVLLVPPARLGRLDPPATLRPVAPTVTEEGSAFQWGGLLGVYQSRLSHWGVDRYAVPLVGEGYVLVYRADVLNDDGFVAAFREKHTRTPLPVRTWDDLTDVGRLATARTGKPALAPLPADPTAAVTALGQVAAPFDRLADHGGTTKGGGASDAYFRGLSFFTDVDVLRNRTSGAWEVRLAAPAFAEAFRWFEATAPFRPAQPGDPTAALIDGSAVAAVVPLGDLTRLPKDAASGAIDAKFGVSAVPGSEAYYDAAGVKQKANGVNRVPYYAAGGLVGVVRKSAAHPDAGWALLAELGGPGGTAATLDTPAVGGGPVRIEHASNTPRLWQQYGFDKERTNDLTRAVVEYVAAGTINPATALRTPDVDAINAVLAGPLAKVAGGQVSADAGHKAAVKGWEELDAKTPREQRVAVRRKSAGMD